MALKIKSPRYFAIVFVALFALGFIGYFLNIIYSISRDMQITASLPPSTLRILQNNDFTQLCKGECANALPDFTKYIFVEHHPFERNGQFYRYLYNSKINKKLGCDAFTHSTELDGFIIAYTDTKNVGLYEDNELACQLYTLLAYFSLPQVKLIRCDTVFGTLPPRSKRRGLPVAGDKPTDKQIIQEIKLQLACEKTEYYPKH